MQIPDKLKQEMLEIGLKKKAGHINESWNALGERFGIPGDRLRKFVEYYGKEHNFSGCLATQTLTKDIFKNDLKKGISDIREYIEKYEITEKIFEDLLDEVKHDGFVIGETRNTAKISKEPLPHETVIDRPWNGEKIIRFGVVSDCHFGSKHQQISHLNTIYDMFKAEGITDVYNAGDLSEGENMRAGHAYECFLHGANQIQQYIVDNYPKKKGIKTYFISGNHDLSTVKACGYDMCIYINSQREDMEYLGALNAKINITPKCVLELNHPLDGSSYALSYSLQKTIDSMFGGEKPHIFINGHHHKAMYFFYRNVHAIEAGSFESQTPWMKGKRLAAHIGGWICELRVDDEGSITRFSPSYIPFYHSIKGDF